MLPYFAIVAHELGHAIQDRKQLEQNINKWLVVSPLLDEELQAKRGQAAIDVRLGFDFCVVTAFNFGAIAEFVGNRDAHEFGQAHRKEFAPLSSSIAIHPHLFFLAQTLEYLKLPPDLMAYVVGRSTRERLGLIVVTAIGIHPGFAGSLTLQLRYLGENPLTLFPGQTLAPLFFHDVVDAEGEASTEFSKKAQCVGARDMVPKRLSDEVTHEKLRKRREGPKSSPAVSLQGKRWSKTQLKLSEYWRTRQDSNLWPLPSEGSALSS